MGLGNKLIVSATGFPGTNKTLRFIQDAFKEPLGALAKLAGDKTIITGVVNTAGVVSNGFISYNGEIIPFVGGNYAATVTIIEEFENVNYNTDANDDTVLDSLPAYRTIYAMCGTGGIDIFNFSDLAVLKTIKELSDPNGIIFTIEMLEHLNSIEFGAQVNIQPDWNATTGSPAAILNQPKTLKVLKTGTFVTGDVPGDADAINIPFGTNIGTTNYTVLYTVYSRDGSGDIDTTAIFTIQDVVFATGFNLIQRELFSGNVQQLKIDYIIIEK